MPHDLTVDTPEDRAPSDPSPDWNQLYEKERTRFKNFTWEVEQVLTKNIDEASVDVFNVEARTKTLESFGEKIGREEKTYSNPLEEITDLSGCRIITFYNEDIESIDKIVRENFEVDEPNSEHKDKIENPKEFGYLSRHLIVSFNKDRLKLNEYKRFVGMKAEIQIRSVLQHAWAAIEHKLQYKRTEDVPQPLQRRLFQISAILEFADDQFAYLRQQIGELRAKYRTELTTGGLAVPLNVESIDVYLEESKFLRQLAKALDGCGINISPRPPNAQNPLSKLMTTLELAKIDGVKKLDDRLRRLKMSEWIEEFKKVFKSWQDQGKVVNGSVELVYGPPKLVLDETALVRIMVIWQCPRKVKKGILEAVPFGDRLQRALEDWAEVHP